MEDLKVLEELFDKKIIRILRVLFRDANKEFFLQEISEKSKVSMATTSRILSKLRRLDIILMRKISRIKLYRLNKNDRILFLSKLFREEPRIMKEFAEVAAGIDGVNTVILHGKEQRDRANVLLIGENIDPGAVKALCAKIKETHKFIVSPLSLTPEQYNQMTQMGLYRETKKILYER